MEGGTLRTITTARHGPERVPISVTSGLRNTRANGMKNNNKKHFALKPDTAKIPRRHGKTNRQRNK